MTVRHGERLGKMRLSPNLKPFCHQLRTAFSVSMVAFLFFFIILQEVQAIEKKKYNVIWLVIDSLRPDHLGCYGYSRNTSAAIDAFSKEGVLFLNAYSQATWTLPSFASFLTSRYVFQHKVVSDRLSLPDSELTIAEILKVFGYQTAAFTTNIHLNRRYNFTKGFDNYEDVPFSKEKWPHPEEHISETLPRVIKWLDDHQNKNFFLLFHANDVHAPLHSWLPAQDENMFDPDYKGVVDNLVLDLPLREKLWGYLLREDNGNCTILKDGDVQHIRAHYDSSIFYMDAYVGKLLKHLKENGLMEKTIVILTADHGVDLLDHGTLFCNAFIPPYEECIHVPLIIVHPDSKTKGHKISELVQSVDILPTILDCLDISPKQDAQGLSLMPLLGGGGHLAKRFIYAESSNPQESALDEPCKFAVRWGNWKLLASFFRSNVPFYTLYDLSKDPGERLNLFNENPEARDKLIAEFWRCYRIQKEK